MTRRCSLSFYGMLFWMVALLTPLPLSNAADPPSVLTVRETGTALYSQQDAETNRIATLEKDEVLFPMFEAIGREVWYMVRTKQGLVGWVRGADVIVGSQARESFKERDSGASTWAARTADGRNYSGTWSLAPNSTRRSATGTWTLRDTSGATVMRGSWSAEKHNTGWNGVWRAEVEGREGEHRGSWSADVPHARNAPFSDLFAAAAKEAISGLWTGGRQSGSWAMRAAKP